MWKFVITGLLLAAVAVPSALLGTQGQSASEARINAYKHEDGRVEFALQVREGDSWGERILPRGRYLGADVRTGRWLSSTPVEISAASPAVRLPVYYPSGDWWGTRIEFIAENDNDIETWRTELKLWAHESNDDRVRSANLSFSCGQGFNDEGRLVYKFNGWWGLQGVAADLNRPVVAHAIGTVQGTWSPHEYYGASGGDGVYQPPETTKRIWRWTDWRNTELSTREFMTELKQYDELTLLASDHSGNVVSATFRLVTAFWTPIQPNLDYCGEY
ncbi:MAG: hypothetical protein F4X57_11195 [Chloroflexi bacterium]|nr:hypothetical protein [Chloroflexota bacterium]